MVGLDDDTLTAKCKSLAATPVVFVKVRTLALGEGVAVTVALARGVPVAVTVGVAVGVQPEQGVAVGVAVVGVAVPQRLVMRPESE